MVSCDTCGRGVSATGFLGGGIVCNDCATDKREGNTDRLRNRIERYGGGEDWGESKDVQELLY